MGENCENDEDYALEVLKRAIGIKERARQTKETITPTES